jgi:triphosphoribosyl-dephospho-CoA synthase
LVVDFEGTRVEHFLASSIAAGPSFQEAASRGIEIAQKKRSLSEAGLGELIKWGVTEIDQWQRGGNTLLGTIMLFAPLSVATGMTLTDNFTIDLSVLRKNMDMLIQASTAQDALAVYEAIDIAKPSGLNNAPDLSVKDQTSKTRLIEENVNLYKVFKIASKYDDICSEWINNFPITFELAYPYLKNEMKKTDLNTAIVNSFLKILSKHPDALISRKVGLVKAKEVSAGAKQILDFGGVKTKEGKECLIAFDKKLRKAGNDYNPGTTADITAAALALTILEGYRP